MEKTDSIGSGYHPTHEVLNQSPPLEDTDLFSTDKPLVEALEREGAGWATGQVRAFGSLMGSLEVVQWGFDANRNTPVLRTHDRNGRRVDEVDFHPAWHNLMRLSVGHRLHCLPWSEPRPGAHVARAALIYLAGQIEAGHCCPISMTYAAMPALRKQPQVCAEWEPRICTDAYDRRFIPASQKTGVLFGMAMTEKQGGSDVRAITTRAVPVGGGVFEIEGHKWFCSAPMCDAFLVLAKAPGGLSCFLVPRWKPDGVRNNFFIQRLKDKLGNRSNASSEVEFAGTYGQLVGEEGRGVPTIIEVANHTRLDCALSSAALMRQALARAIHHARHRSAFGRRLADHPLMQNVLAVLDLQAGSSSRSRGARVPGGQWLCRRLHPGSTVSRISAEFGLGRLGKCHLPRCIACHVQGSSRRRGIAARSRTRRRRRPPAGRVPDNAKGPDSQPRRLRTASASDR
jgi:putative acyl-CoA dehydrogenase